MKIRNKNLFRVMFGSLFILSSCNQVLETKGSMDSGYNAEVYSIMSQNCYQCHANGNAEGITPFGNIDDVTAMLLSGRIDPITPADSPIYKKIMGTGGNARMPWGGPYLSKADSDAVLEWIGSLGGAEAGCKKFDDVNNNPTWNGANGVHTLFDAVDMKSPAGVTGSSPSTCLGCHRNGADSSSSQFKMSFSNATPANATTATVAPLPLNSGSAYRLNDNLIGDSSTSTADYAKFMGLDGSGRLGSYDTGRKIIIPGDPCNSTLYRRVSSYVKPGSSFTIGSVRVMPKDATPTSVGTSAIRRMYTDTELAKLYEWIKDGALNN